MKAESHPNPVATLYPLIHLQVLIVVSDALVLVDFCNNLEEAKHSEVCDVFIFARPYLNVVVASRLANSVLFLLKFPNK